MAEIYRRPLNVFFLPEPPADRGELAVPDFRTLPEGAPRERSRPLRFALRRMTEWRLDVFDLCRDLGTELPNFTLRASPDENPEVAATRFREMLGVSHEEQATWPQHDRYHAFNTWRDRIESQGVLVFQANRVSVEEMRGASRFEEVLPVILTNAGDSPRGRSFTLLHELVHLALHDSGLCVPTTARANIPRANPTEIFCNYVAGAILVPRERLIAHPIVAADRLADSWSDDELRSIANDFSVSRFVVLRRLVLLDRASAAFYDRKHQEWSAQILAAPAGGDGRRTNLSARGRTFTRLVLAAYGADKITLRDTARYLGIKAPDLQMARDYAWS